MNFEEIVVEELQQIITQHKQFNRFKSIQDADRFVSERNKELIFHYCEDGIDEDVKVKQSCYIAQGTPNLKTKIYFWDADKAKWIVTKKNIRFLDSILESIECFDDVIAPAKLEKMGQISLFKEVM